MARARYSTRMAWLRAAWRALRPVARAAGADPPRSTAFAIFTPDPSNRDRWGWHERLEGGRHLVGISSTLSRPTTILAVLLHESLHAASPSEVIHRRPFSTYHAAVGFACPPSRSRPGTALRGHLRVIARRLGPYPPRRMP